MKNLRKSAATACAKQVTIFAVLTALVAPVPAFADLMLFPTRVVMEDGVRSAQVELVNRDTTPASYKINLINRRMTETGEIVEAEDVRPDEAFADKMVFFTPRLVTLQPGSSQIVRIAVRRPPGLASGEYRTHLQFDRLPEIDSSNIEQLRQNSPAEAATFRLTALIGASIPVIVRQGATEATVTIAALGLTTSPDKREQALTFEIRRSGNRSTYGDIVATFEQPGSKPITLGMAAGVAVYVPNSVRRSSLPLTVPPGLKLQRGQIVLRYQARSDEGGAIMAEEALALP